MLCNCQEIKQVEIWPILHCKKEDIYLLPNINILMIRCCNTQKGVDQMHVILYYKCFNVQFRGVSPQSKACPGEKVWMQPPTAVVSSLFPVS